LSFSSSAEIRPTSNRDLLHLAWEATITNNMLYTSFLTSPRITQYQVPASYFIAHAFTKYSSMTYY